MNNQSIRLIAENKKELLPLLLLGDELESDIEKYLERGDLFALYDGDLKSVCVVTDESGGVLEIQNLATDTRYQRQGYAARLVDHVANHYAGRNDKIILGTGDVPGVLSFYEKCGFVRTHSIADYFTTHFDYPIIEEGIVLKDKVYLERSLVPDALTVGYKATLRIEKKSDWKIVEQLTYRAFRDAPPTGSGDDGNEALLARKLRSCASFVPELDYVAELDGSVIGNIMYARCKIVSDGGEWETLTFGPVSVLPKNQRHGVGSALIRKTLDIARDLGYRAVLIFGHESYYPRFGFKPASEFGITTADGKNFPAFMVLPLCEGALDGIHGRFMLDDVYTTLDREESDKLNAKLAEPMDVDEYIDAQQDMHKDKLRTVHS